MKNILFIILLAIFAGCNRTGPSKPAATGRAGEMLVVMSEHKWEGRAGESVRNVFNDTVPMLTSFEPMFDIVQMEEKSFVKLFETHRHIFIADINPEYEKATIEINRDHWSYPQMVIRVKAPSDSLFDRVMRVNKQSFTQHFMDTEMLRLTNSYKRMLNHEARTAIRDKFGFEMLVPDGYYVAVQDEDFIWVRRTGTREDLEMGVLISILPYTDPDFDFAHPTIRARRDSITRKYIPGTLPGSYMATYAELDHEYREVSFNGRYSIETRGLWRLEGDFMGGPFVNYTLVDEKNNKVVILDGFLYAPDFKKRDYLRQLEALIKSLELPGNDTQEEVAAAPEV